MMNVINTLVSLVEGSCSFDAVAEYKRRIEESTKTTLKILYVNSFYEGKDLLSKNQDTSIVMLVPHVHEMCAILTTHPDFELLVNDVYAKINPPLYLAKATKKGFHMNDKRCASVPALKTLIPDSKNDLFQLYFVHNTQEAAHCVATGECGYCITNEYGLKRNNLIAVEKLKPMNILWFPFRWVESYKL